MKTLTNHTAGPKGINLKNGTTRWLEPGESAEIDPKDILGDVPDLGKPGTKETDDGELASLKAKLADLTKQVEELSAEKADLTKQVEELTKPAK